MNKLEFYEMMYDRALAMGNGEMAKNYEMKYSFEKRLREEKLLKKVLVGLVVVTLVSPWFIWWVSKWIN